MTAPTHEAYAELQQAFDHFNAVLFGGQLELPLFTLQRERRTYGYCSRQRFVSRSSGAMVDEIAMNPAYFAVRSIRETLSTLVHEMVHQWQFHFGKPGRGGYHNIEWGFKMESVGLMPSNTGAPGGKKTGDQMTHYIIDGGPFARACAQLLTLPFTLSWCDRFPPYCPTATPTEASGQEDATGPALATPTWGGLVTPPPPAPVNRSNRLKYRCPRCGAQAWAKPGLRLLCGGEKCAAAELEASNDGSPVSPAKRSRSGTRSQRLE